MSAGNHPSYRRDIDGLRAWAVLSVVFYHAAPSLLPGGFIGVDVFFVISGYLISTIILHGLAQGDFSYLDFYSRRIKRIFPALILVLFACWVVGWLMLFPDEYRSLNKHIASGTAFISNIVLWKESGYFDTNSALKPLLHLWSLGIEEQFYIAWPLFLAITWRWRAVQLAIIVLGLLGSFFINVIEVKMHPVSTFYLPPARFWELLAGCVLAYLQLFHSEALKCLSAKPKRDLLSIIGFVLLVAALLVINEQRVFPGWWALMPTTGAALLLYAGTDAWVNRQILANRAMVFVGLISYPLYLWHWPLLSFTHIIEGPNVSNWEIAIIVGLAFILATATYHYIERPIRSSHRTFAPAIPLFITASLVGIFAIVDFQKPLLPRSAHYGVEKILDATTEIPFPGPHLKRLSDSLPVYVEGNGPNKVLLVGDSNIEQYYPRIDRLLTADIHNSYSAEFLTSGGCPPLPGVTERQHPECEELTAHVMQFASDPDVHTVVIGANWAGYFLEPDARYFYQFKDATYTGPIYLGTAGFVKSLHALEVMIDELDKLHKHVVLILQIPIGEAMDPIKMIKRGFSENFAIDVHPLDRNAIIRRTASFVSRLKAIAARTGTEVIDPLESLCVMQTCPTIQPDGKPIYKDGGHIRPSYVRDNVRYLDAIFPVYSTTATQSSGMSPTSPPQLQ